MNRWYWVVRCDNTVEDPMVVGASNLGMDPELLDIGKAVETWSNFAWMRATGPEDDGTPDDVLQNHLGLPVYSAPLRAALQRAGVGGIQYLPVRVFRPNGELLPGFAIANLLERRAALDLARSDYNVYPDDYFLPERRGKVAGLRKVVLRADRLAGCDILRLDESPAFEFASEKFKTAFEAGGFTGYSFHEVATS